MDYFVKYAIIVAIVLAVTGLWLQGKIHKAKEEGTDKMAHKNNNEALETNADGIRAKMCDDIFEEFKQLVKKQVEPWAFFNSGKGDVRTFDNKSISFSGGFSGSKREVFLKSYIEPFIEDIIKTNISINN